MKIEVHGLDRVLKKLRLYEGSLINKQRELLERLSEIGIRTASVRFSQAQYDGENDVVVSSSPEWIDENRLFLTASGKAVLFIEFGSGAKYGYGHPAGEKMGYVPGSWSDNEEKGGRHHWQDENGWYYEHEKISHGNPPARAMYDAAKEMRADILRIAKEVYGSDRH